MKAEVDRAQKQITVLLTEKNETQDNNRELNCIVDELKQKLLKFEANKTKLDDDIIELNSRLSFFK